MVCLCLIGNFLGAVPSWIAGVKKTAQFVEQMLPRGTIEALRTISKIANQNGYVNGRWMGSAYEFPEETLMLLNLSTPRGPAERMETVCEIGFNAGLSAALLLTYNNATLQDFDTMANSWSSAVVEAFQSLYPGRLKLHKGDSSCTVRKALKLAGGGKALCDRFFVDGGHSNPAVTNDFRSAMRFTRHGGLVMIDDCTHRFPDIRPQWNRLVAEGLLEHAHCVVKRLKPPTGWRGFCVGQRTRKVMPRERPLYVNCSAAASRARIATIGVGWH